MISKVDDCFTIKDVLENGPEVWERVRAKIRSQGYKVTENYGMYDQIYERARFMRLYKDGDMITSVHQPLGGRLITIKEFLGEKVVFDVIKLRCNKRHSMNLAIDYLVECGYDDKHRGVILELTQSTGVLGDKDGVIYSISGEGTFSNSYKHATEIKFDVEETTTYKMTNVKVVEVETTVLGYSVNEAKLREWLKLNAQKSAA